MANLTEASTFDAGVYQIETTDPVSGGAAGIANKPLINLANRTKYLKDHLDLIEAGTTNLPGYAKLASPTFTGSPAAPTPALGDDDTSLATTAFVQDTLGGVLSKSVAGGVNVTLTAVEAGNGILVFSGALTANINVIVPATPTRPWIVYNNTSGAFTLTVKTAAGTGQAVTQGKVALLFSDGTNVLDGMTDTAAMGLTGAITSILTSNLTASMVMVTDASGKVANHASVTAAELGYLDGVTSAIQTQLDGKAASGHTHAGYAPLAGPAFTGNPTAPTPLQFDDDTSLATTAFVRRELGGVRGYDTFVSGTTFTSSDVGKILLYANAANGSATLPSPSIGVGASLYFYNSQNFSVTLTSPSGAIAAPATDAASYTLGRNETLVLLSDGANWRMISGSALNNRSGGFLSSLAQNGYQKLPSGLILQWGVVGQSAAGIYTVTLPISFPNLFCGVQMLIRDLISTNGYCEMQALPANLSSFQYTSRYQTSNNQQWFAYGY